MGQLNEKRLQILEQFCMIIERGELLGSKVTEQSIINIHRVDPEFAIVHFSRKKRMIDGIRWACKLSDEEQCIVDRRRHHFMPVM